MRIPFTLAALALMTAPPALAQNDSGTQEPPRKVREVYKDVEYLEFDTVVLDVAIRKPAGMLITGHQEGSFESMIDERVHFKRELAKSAGFGIKRSTAGETAPK